MVIYQTSHIEDMTWHPFILVNYCYTYSQHLIICPRIWTLGTYHTHTKGAVHLPQLSGVNLPVNDNNDPQTTLKTQGGSQTYLSPLPRLEILFLVRFYVCYLVAFLEGGQEVSTKSTLSLSSVPTTVQEQTLYLDQTGGLRMLFFRSCIKKKSVSH